MKKTFLYSIAILGFFGLTSVSAWADHHKTRTPEACEKFKHSFGKNPACKSLEPQVAAIKCTDPKASETIDKIHVECKEKAKSWAANANAKLDELKKADPNDPRIQELKKKIEERKAAKAAAGK